MPLDHSPLAHLLSFSGCEAELFTKDQENALLRAEILQLKKQKPLNEGNCKVLQEQSKQLQEKRLQAFPKKIQAECAYYHTLDNPRRATTFVANNVSAKEDCYYKASLDRETIAPQWGGTGRYRFSGPFTRMAVKGEVKGNWQCGTEYPVYIEDPNAHHNLKVGEMKNSVKICYIWDKKTSYCSPLSIQSITITRCPGNFFVYRLPNLKFDMGYCGAE